MTTPSLDEIRTRLDTVSREMVTIIHTYGLDETDPLRVVENARDRITVPDDYVRFLELSLEGRILGELGAALLESQTPS